MADQLDPVLQAMQAQFQAQAAFHDMARQAMMDESGPSPAVVPPPLRAPRAAEAPAGLNATGPGSAPAGSLANLLPPNLLPPNLLPQDGRPPLPSLQQLTQLLQQQQQAGGQQSMPSMTPPPHSGTSSSAPPPGMPPLPVPQNRTVMPPGSTPSAISVAAPPGLVPPPFTGDAKAQLATLEAARNALLKEQKAKQDEEEKARLREAERLRCHLHKKPKEKGCKFCRKWLDVLNQGKEDKAAQQQAAAKQQASGGAGLQDAFVGGLLEVANPKTYGLPPLLQSHIIESQHFKSLMSIDIFEQIVEEVCQFADSVEPYNQNSSTVPSALFCCLYRLFSMGLDSRRLQHLINSQESPFVRCVGFLFVRFALDPGQLWSWLGEYVLDEEEFHPAKDSDWVTTVGEFVEALLSQERYYSVVLPRLPMGAKRGLEAKLAMVPQFRKRTQANQRLLDVYRRDDVQVEACPEEDGTWQSGWTVELDDTHPTRPKLKVMLKSGKEVSVHIGRVILSDPNFSTANGYYRPARNRSRSRSFDWSRHKGRSQAELIDEQRSRDRDRAVCASGKEYARKPVGVKVACALPREMGAASHRLLEDETFVPKERSKRRRSPSPRQEEHKRVQHSAEHQAQMQQLFEKYVMQKPHDAYAGHGSGGGGSAGGSGAGVNFMTQGEGPDVMRLG